MPKGHFCFFHGHGLPFPNPKTRNTYHELTAYPRTKDQSAQLRGHICDHAAGFAAREQDTPQPRAFLGGGPQPLFVELIGLGASNRVNADPPDVFRMAIYKLASKLILVHNHPSGTYEVTDADITFTDHMLKVGKLIKVEVLDHLVITETNYTSFADQGVMDELQKSGLFEIMGPEKQELEQFKIDTEKKRAKKENSLEIAKKLKAQGVDTEIIKKATGLSLKEIGGI